MLKTETGYLSIKQAEAGKKSFSVLLLNFMSTDLKQRR